MKRKIIKIDEELCNGCGECIPNCPEGALQIIDGKARLISDLFCDGLGACIGECPTGAMETEEREAEPYDEERVMANVVKQGENTIKAHLEHLKEHGEHTYFNQAVEYLKKKDIPVPQCKVGPPPVGCPGSRTTAMDRNKTKTDNPAAGKINSELNTWPVQLHLLNPDAPYLKNADLLVAASCVAYSFGDFHRRFLKDKVPIIFCPKLDRDIERYVEKLSNIFSRKDINSVTITRMEVPCCGGTLAIVQQALKRSGKNVIIKEYTISLQGEII